MSNRVAIVTGGTSGIGRATALALKEAGCTVYELSHMRIPSMVLAHHEREARHTFARPRNGFAFVGIMDRVSDAKIRNVFLAMLKNPRRKRFWDRQNALDFTTNKGRVVALMQNILQEGAAAPLAAESASAAMGADQQA